MERVRPHPPTFQAKYVAARDRRYEKSKPRERDRQQIIAAFGLTQEQWDAVQPTYQAAVTEYFTNIMAELYGKHNPLVDAEAKLQEAKEAGTKLYNDFIAELQDAISSNTIDNIRENHLYFGSALDEVRVNIQRICNTFTDRLTEYIPRNRLDALLSEIIDATMLLVRDYKNDIATLESIQNLHHYCVTAADEYTLIQSLVLRNHDWVHAAEDTAGTKSNLSRMSTGNKRQQYTDPNMYINELFATLFLPVQKIDGSIPETNLFIGLQHQKHRTALINRATIAKLYSRDSRIQKLEAAVIQLLSEPMANRNEKYRRWEYEQYIKLMALQQMLIVIPDCTAAEIMAVEEAFDELTDAERPEHYKRFGKKVFALEFQKNPYLFLEEFLRMIGALAPGQSVAQ